MLPPYPAFSRRNSLKRLFGSLLVGWVAGSFLDPLFQFLVLGRDPEQMKFPYVGISLGWIFFFSLWGWLGRVQLRGMVRTLAIAIPVGVAAGAILGAVVYAPIRTALDSRTDDLLRDKVNSIHRVTGLFLGIVLGACLGAVAGVFAHRWREPDDGDPVERSTPSH